MEKFKYYEEKELLAFSLNNYIAIDRAYSLDKSADFTGIVVISVDIQNNWYIRIAERFRGTEGDLIKKIFDLKSYFNPVRIGIEQKAFQYTIKPTLEEEMRKQGNFFLVDELKDLGKSKNIRIEGLVPRFEMQTVFLKRDQLDLQDELITYPASVHDDLMDALAYGLTMCQSPIQGNTVTQFIPKNLKR